MSQYVIVGDTEQYKECLVCVLYASNKEIADKRFVEILSSKIEREKYSIPKYSNLKVVEVKDKDCWWFDGCD